VWARAAWAALLAIVVLSAAVLNEVAQGFVENPSGASFVAVRKWSAIIGNYSKKQISMRADTWDGVRCIFSQINNDAQIFSDEWFWQTLTQLSSTVPRWENRGNKKIMVIVNLDGGQRLSAFHELDPYIFNDGWGLSVVGDRIFNVWRQEGNVVAGLKAANVKDEDIWPLDFDQSVAGNFGLNNRSDCRTFCCSGGYGSRVGRYFSVFKTFEDEPQLPYEQSSLCDSGAKQENCEQRKPVRIVRDPLRFESEFFIDFRFLLALVILLIGLLLGIGSGLYFYRERYLIGAALIGCGWLCGLLVLGTNWLLPGAPL